MAADCFVVAMRALSVESAPDGPEYDAAPEQVGLEREQFDPWYRVQYQIQFVGRARTRVPTDAQCAEAFERYAMGRADFY